MQHCVSLPEIGEQNLNEIQFMNGAISRMIDSEYVDARKNRITRYVKDVLQAHQFGSGPIRFRSHPSIFLRATAPGTRNDSRALLRLFAAYRNQ